MINSTESKVQTIKCKISPNDKMPVIDYFVNSITPQDSFLVACDANHFTDFTFDLVNQVFKEGPRTGAVDIIDSSNKDGVQAIPLQHTGLYVNTKSFLIAESVEGASVYLRTMIENLVNENFAVKFFHNPQLNLKIREDKQKFECAQDFFRRIGVSLVLEIMSGNIVQRDNHWIRKKCYKERTTEVTNWNRQRKCFHDYYNNLEQNLRMMDSELCWKLFTAYVDLSEGIHGGHVPSLTRVDTIFGDVLKSYEDYISIRHNKWMVIP